MFRRKDKEVLFLISFIICSNAFAQDPGLDLVLDEPGDLEVLLQDFEDTSEDAPALEESTEITETVSEDDLLEDLDMSEEVSSEKDLISEEPVADDLEQLKNDLGELEEILPEESETPTALKDTTLEKEKQVLEGVKPKIFNDDIVSGADQFVFDIGKEEKELLEIAKNMQGKIPENEWNELAASASTNAYTVMSGDWLWKISKKIFGSGFYYSKIWALNPYITNPHLIEPGMVLTFTSGTDDSLPDVKVGSFSGNQNLVIKDEYEKWGEDTKPKWIEERDAIIEDGINIEYASELTRDDLKALSSTALIKEYESYEPPKPDFIIEVPGDEYDESGFDAITKVQYNFKEGFYLTTFVSSNIIQDFGKVESAIDEQVMFTKFDKIFIRIDENIDVIPGDKFSIYAANGEVENENSDRKGFKYSIVGNIKIIQKHDSLWEADITETSGVIQRGDRITIYTPKIDRITRTFNERTIEAAVMGAYSPLQRYVSYGDVVYLDRGRADGVEVGNVFEIYGFKDRGTDKLISENPTYKNGEVTVVTLTDNFATAIVSSSKRDFEVGSLAVTKSKASAIRATKSKMAKLDEDVTTLKTKALDELDVELNIDNLNDSLLDQADKIKFTEDELAELERQEKEKSFMTEKERDLRALERLEDEIETAEKMLREAKLDEDKMLENNSLEELEKGMKYKEQEALDEIEENFGKRYLDEPLNDKDNPFGLTEYDIEEIDELLNLENSEEVKNDMKLDEISDEVLSE
jgi:hypothetical protein